MEAEEITGLEVEQCQHEGCEAEGIPCLLPWVPSMGEVKDEEKPDEWFCVKHTYEHGYCFMCGMFSSGIETFDFPTTYGVIEGACYECSGVMKAEFEEDTNFEDVDDYIL